jgi:DNA (cytosine-5)-methyltransferase 1
MTKVDWNEYRHAADVVVGGSPCQAFSIAGLRKALDDPRGQLMLEYIRACHAIDPEWIVWENVPGALSAQGGRAFQTLLGAVAELWPDGGAAWRVLDAQFSGVAQRRRRVFLVVNTRDWRRAGPVLFERESVQWDSASSRAKRQALTKRAANGVGTAGFNYNAGANARSLAVSEELSPTLKTEHNPAVYQIAGNIIGRDDMNGGHQLGVTDPDEDGAFTLTGTDRHAVAFAQNQRDEVRDLHDCAGALAAQPGIKQQTFVYCATGSGSNMSHTSNGDDVFPALCATDGDKQFLDNQSVHGGRLLIDATVKSTSYVFGADNAASGGLSLSEETSPTLGTTKTPAVKPPYSGMLRRLTPKECERLQGFPDGYTDISYRGKPHAPDSARYKALGNSMAVPVMRWIGEGISLVDREMGR